MNIDQVLKALDCRKNSSTKSRCHKDCPFFGHGEDCLVSIANDAMSLIMQGELNEGTMNLVNEQGELIDELNCWHKLLWRFIHSDKKIEDAFYKFYNIKRTNGPIAQ